MKIRNILIASLAVFAFASCSKDEGNEPEKPRDPVDAVFSIQLTSDLGTKALDNGTDSVKNKGLYTEIYVSTLNTYVFNAKTGALVTHSFTTNTKDNPFYNAEKGLTGVKDLVVKVVPNASGTSSDDEFKLVLIANLVGSTSFNSLDALEESKLDQDVKNYNNKAGDFPALQHLPMRSEIISFGKLSPAEKNADGTWGPINWVRNDGSVYLSEGEGQTENKFIKLTRMVARVQIDQIKVDLADRYPNASFQLKSMSLANVRSNVTLKGEGAGSFVKGYESDNFNLNNGGAGIIVPANPDKSNVLDHFIRTWNNETFYKGTEEIFDQSNEQYFDDNGKNLRYFFSYVFPNSEKTTVSGEKYYNTGVLLSGMFKVSDNAVPELRHYWVPLNKGGKYEVLPNTIYHLLITINGEGSKDEDKPEITAGVTAKITVADWVVKEQIEEDNN